MPTPISRGKSKDAKGSSTTISSSQPSTLVKAFLTNVEWEREELADVFFWIRQILAAICGIAWGVLAFRGLWALIGFIFFSTVVSLAYSRRVFTPDEAMESWDIIWEGFLESVMCFIFWWVMAFNLAWF